MADLLQAIGRVGRGVGTRAVIDVFYSHTDLPRSDPGSVKAAPEPAVLELCFGRPLINGKLAPPLCRHLSFAEFFAWEPKYFEGYASIEQFVGMERDKLMHLHDCCDVCALACECSRLDPQRRGCSVWRALLAKWGR
jgi:hypothetical protein